MDEYKQKIKKLLVNNSKWKEENWRNKKIEKDTERQIDTLLYQIGRIKKLDDFFSYENIDILTLAIQKKRIKFLKKYFQLIKDTKKKLKEKNLISDYYKSKSSDFKRFERSFKSYKPFELFKFYDNKPYNQSIDYIDFKLIKGDYSLIMNHPLIQAVKVRNNHEIIKLLLKNGFSIDVIFRFELDDRKYTYELWHFCLFYDENIRSLFNIKNKYKIIKGDIPDFIKQKQKDISDIYKEDLIDRFIDNAYIDVLFGRNQNLHSVMLLNYNLLKDVIYSLYSDSLFDKDENRFEISENNKKRLIRMIYVNGDPDAIRLIFRNEKDKNYLLDFDLISILDKTNNDIGINYLLKETNKTNKTNKLCTNFAYDYYNKLYEIVKDYHINVIDKEECYKEMIKLKVSGSGFNQRYRSMSDTSNTSFSPDDTKNSLEVNRNSFSSSNAQKYREQYIPDNDSTNLSEYNYDLEPM